MPEKAALVLLSNFMLQWRFKILAFATFLGIFTAWAIDGLNIYTFYNFALVKLNTSQLLSHSHKDSNFTNTSVQPHLRNPHHIDLPTTPQTLSISNSTPQISRNFSWISSDFEANYTSNLLEKWLERGGEPCKDSRTMEIKIPSFDGNRNIQLSTGDAHEFIFHTLDDLGSPHCIGGDYFETDLSSERWKSRPPVKDIGNGSYSFLLQVHPSFAGDYNFTIILLFRHFEGLKFSPERFTVDKVIRFVHIHFVNSSSHLPELRQCNKLDYFKNSWSGRWTRLARNDSCLISDDGRYRCLEPNFPCNKPWCDGPLGLLESNGWVYSSHCSFKFLNSQEIWNCLNKRWIFWWGDSNHCDTIRNMLNFMLDVHDVSDVPRIFDSNITNPKNQSQVVRFTSIFNGHPISSGNYEGLNSLTNSKYRDFLKGFFLQEVVPDFIVMNSGLHDGVHWPNIRQFVKGAECAAEFWAEVKEGVRERGVAAPEIIYRTTVATGGYARRLAFNPHKMEAFNGIVLEKLREYGVVDRVVDGFDLTYPWHYDNRANDGVHYGRAPAKMRWKDGQIGHEYFVDLMLGHVLINAMCM